jgi:acyl-CoA reductase-like NAD-dependent aldehyde dehydrogenase
MSDVLKTISPVDGSLYVERSLADDGEIDRRLASATAAQPGWKAVPIADRVALLRSLVGHFVAQQDDIADEISWQMGRPRSQSPGEVRGFEDRATTMLELAESALADVAPPATSGLERFIRREPLGVVLCLAPWNYPYLCAVNAIIPAMAAGNTVILKHSGQTPLCAERIAQAAQAAGLPPGVFQVVHCSHAAVAAMIGDPRIDFVAFTGSVEGGHAVQQAAATRFIATGLELGGKDPAYVRADADLGHAVDNLVDGAFFNSGQSCCGVERIYVHRSLYGDFIDAFAAQVGEYRLGNPMDPNTNLGPMVRASAADFVRTQVAAAIEAGARPLVDAARFAEASDTGPYLAPQVLCDVDHTMDIMREETFGPVVGIMAVDDDAQATALMNDSRFGLTASLWTRDPAAARSLGDRLQTGTVFMNRCDYLDPQLAWVGVKDSGRGCTLSRIGYESLTRPKSFHLRMSPG